MTTSFTVKGITANYKQTLRQVALPAGFTWEESLDTVLRTVGKQVFIAKYVPANGKSEITGIPITVTVKESNQEELCIYWMVCRQ